MKEIFERIASDTTQKKQVVSLAKKLVKKFSVKSGSDLEKLKDLCYWLYVQDQKDKSILVCEIVDQVSFENDFNIWTWIESIIALHIRIMREQNDIEKVEIYRTKLMTSYKEDPKLLSEILNGSGLYDDEIKSDENDGDEKGANTWRFLQLNQLCLMRELGGSSTYPIDKIDREIERLITLLKNL